MAPPMEELSSKVFFHFKNTTCTAKVVYSEEYKKNSITLQKEVIYEGGDEGAKLNKSYVTFSICAAKDLLEILPRLIQDAEQLKPGERDLSDGSVCVFAFVQ
jgi:hypothetical protein